MFILQLYDCCMKNFLNLICFLLFTTGNIFSQDIKVVPIPSQQKVVITIDNKLFTEFIYPDSLEKPVLYPIYAADGEIITRGFPISPRPNEPTDHPHHIGLWMNYENVNGLDFWNNSYAIPAEKKSSYGWIKTNKIIETKSGREGVLKYNAEWKDIKGNILLSETTGFIFSAPFFLRRLYPVFTNAINPNLFAELTIFFLKLNPFAKGLANMLTLLSSNFHVPLAISLFRKAGKRLSAVDLSKYLGILLK